MAHRSGFTETTLREALRGSGLPAVATLRRPGAFELRTLACKGPTRETELRALAQTFLAR